MRVRRCGFDRWTVSREVEGWEEIAGVVRGHDGAFFAYCASYPEIGEPLIAEEPIQHVFGSVGAAAEALAT